MPVDGQADPVRIVRRIVCAARVESWSDGYDDAGSGPPRRNDGPKGRTMAPTHEPVSVLGIGTMGHGIALSALPAGIPTILWHREPATTRALAALRAAAPES